MGKLVGVGWGIADEMLQAGRQAAVQCAASGNCFIANPLERHLNARQDLWLPGVASKPGRQPGRRPDRAPDRLAKAESVSTLPHMRINNNNNNSNNTGSLNITTDPAECNLPQQLFTIHTRVCLIFKIFT